MPWKKIPDTHLVDLLMNIDTSGRGIDVGCGTGADALYLANNYFEEVIAVDKYGNQIMEEVRRHPNIEVIEDDWVEYVKNKKFHLIVSRCSAFSLDQVEVLLSSLSDGGHLFLKTFSDRISKEEIIPLVKDYQHTIRKYIIKENHEPLGEHEHTILFVIVNKNSGNIKQEH